MIFSGAKNIKLQLFSDDGKALRLLIIICGVIGLISAIQHWMVLIDKFGSISAVLIKANLIYRMRVNGEISGTIPYLFSVAYSGVFLSGMYIAYKNKLDFVSIIPFIAVILKDSASVGRGGIFVGFLEFLIAFFLVRHLLSDKKTVAVGKKKNLVVTLIVFAALFVVSSTLVKSFRGTFENFKGATSALNKTKSGAIISPSIYMYFSSNVGVFSKYFEKGGEDAYFGENTFLPIYNLVSKTGLIKHGDFYPKGYYIPMWTNSATYLRDLHADFGYLGLFLAPYLLGLITTFFWFRFFEKGNALDYVILGHLVLIISFSVFYMATRSAAFLISFLFLLAVIPVVERIAVKNILRKIKFL
jgi:oligosaccharide repeat unit polymerase